MKKSLLFITLLVLALLLGTLIGRYIIQPTASSPNPSSNDKLIKKPLYWIDPMEPQIHYPKPGKSRMGMELTPVYPEDSSADTRTETTVTLSPAMINNLGVRTASVIKGDLARRIETVGYVEPNENMLSHVHSYADGWVEKLYVKAAGESVKKGQLLLQLYSPLLVNAQNEYLIALNSVNTSMIESARKKLLAFRISEQQIQQLKQTRKASPFIDVYSLQDGIVDRLNIREGMRVTPDMEIMSLLDLSTVWMLAHIAERQSSWVHVGETALAKLNAFPGRVWQGKVEFIYPELDPTTRTLAVRFLFVNPDHLLKPNMVADIVLLGDSKNEVLSIPLEALIRSKQGDRVIVALRDGRFQMRVVVSGMESGDRVEIISGLKEGEKIVTSGQFLLDSEANLKASAHRLDPSTTSSPLTQAKASAAIESQGIVRAMNISERRLTLQHEAIAALQWPAMTMDFVVANSVSLENVNIGDPIRFTLEKSKDNSFVITAITKISNKQETQ